ncbi:MAG TPA: glycosyltransferase family 4 protein [Bacteroidales bacterium]|nr:glycosyltransferase family 4 protein [Bacteroidales bacterium]
MRVLLTTDNLGGVWTFTLNLAEGLRNYGIEVFIAVTGTELSSSQEDNIRSFNHDLILTKQEWMDNPWDDLDRAGRQLFLITKIIKPDIVHLNSFTFGSLQWDVPVVITAHSCVLSWWESVLNEKAPPEWDIYRSIIGKGIRSADLLVAPSFAMMETAKRLYSPRCISLIYNGIEQSDFFVVGKEEMIFSMGRLWDKAKNIKLVLEAANDINYPIYIAGDYSGSQAETPDNVHFLGYLDQSLVRGYLSRSSIYLLPVKYEPFGYTFLEAALSGCALITGHIQSMREIWNESAMFCDPNDSRALAETVNSLMADKVMMSKLAKSAKERAGSMYSIEKMTAGYIREYNRILKSASKQALKTEV